METLTLVQEESLLSWTLATPKIPNPAMGNLRPAGHMRPFKLFVVALPEPLKYDYFIDKTNKSVETVTILALDMTF